MNFQHFFTQYKLQHNLLNIVNSMFTFLFLTSCEDYTIADFIHVMIKIKKTKLNN